MTRCPDCSKQVANLRKHRLRGRCTKDKPSGVACHEVPVWIDGQVQMMPRPLAQKELKRIRNDRKKKKRGLHA